MKEMRIYTVLNAGLPVEASRHWGQARQIRLWIAAPSKRWAVTQLKELDVWWREETFAGPVRPGVFLNTLRRHGLLDRPAVLAYPVPWTADTPVLQVSSKTRLDPFVRMGDIVPGQ